MHRDFHCVIDSTMVRLWYRDETVRATVRDALAAVPSLQFIDAAYQKKERIYFQDERFFQDLYLADPGVLLVPSHLGKKPLAGMHGYSCDHVDSDASFLTNDAHAAPRSIVDIYELMRASVEAAAQCRSASVSASASAPTPATIGHVA